MSPELQIKRMIETLHKAKSDGFDPVWDCQVVVAVNDKSPLSRKAVNKILQEHLNPNERPKGSPFAVADKIVNLKNGYFPLADEFGGFDDSESDEVDDTKNDRGEVYVANGELAKVLVVEPKRIIARMSNPDRVIVIPRGKASESSGDDSGESSDAKTNTGCSWDLGYGLSVHKSQGSEWPVVLVLIDDYPGARIVCDRSWIYTAISRAKERCVLIGKKTTADAMAKRANLKGRKTFLSELIRKMLAERELESI